jgi:hypothetical protein
MKRRTQRQMRPHIFLHIGTHKTGTTFLQYLFRNHRKELLEADRLLFPKVGLSAKKRISPKPDGLPGHDGFTREADRKSLIRKLVSEVAAAKPTRVFISAEGLGPARPQFVRALVDDLEKIGPVSILLVLRRQDKWIDSFYRQAVSGNRHGETLDFRGYLNEKGPRLLDYGARFKHWRQAPCTGQFLVASYDDLVADNNLLGWFCDTLDVSKSAELLRQADVPSYPSLTRIDTEITRLMNLMPHLGSVRRAELLQHVYDLGVVPDAPFVSSEMFHELRSLYEPKNRALAEEWGIRPASEFIVWREPKVSVEWEGLETVAVKLAAAANGVYRPYGKTRGMRRVVDVFAALQPKVRTRVSGGEP